MPGQEQFDAHAILASLGITDVTDLQPVTGGMDTAIWRVTWNGQPYALRLMRPQQAATYEREVAAMQAAAAGGVVVPELVRHSLWEGRPVLLLSWLRGGKPDFWLQAQHLDSVRAWRDLWKRKAGMKT